MGSPTLRPFNALNGLELKKIILKEIENYLDNDFHFRQSAAYPLISWGWKAAFNMYPNEPGHFEVSIGPKEIRAPGYEGTPEADPVQVDIGATRDVTAPAGQSADSARRDANLPIPATRVVKGPGGQRMVVDAPSIGPGAAAVSSAGEEPAVQTNADKAGHIFARSATVKTKAAPDGVEVLPAAGTKPGIEETQQILEREANAPKE
ncbi:MAG TPA: hypothetical protein VN976_22010 [Verrucomicrobiae bacterium]|nr:hypothetical protein [Verrucomicrobiae bacterium]